jgi:hypothetical protein
MKQMVMRGFLLVLLMMANVSAKDAPVNIIFDTDMSGDCDDVGALTVLNNAAGKGDAKILACLVDTHDQDKAIAAAIDAINTYYGRPHIPIGTYQGTKFPPGHSPYTKALRDEFPHTALPDDQMPKAVDVYRQTLAAQPDHSVTIVSVGMLVNLAELLKSTPDAFSPLNGVELVRKKVKQLVVMGGHFPGTAKDFECNFSTSDEPLFTQYAVENWPTPILFSGFEIGAAIVTGKPFKDAPPSPMRRAYELYTQFNGRESWDPTAALAAVQDPNLYWTIKADGYCHVNADGSSVWTQTPHRGHSYLVPKVPPENVRKVLDDIYITPPTKK